MDSTRTLYDLPEFLIPLLETFNHRLGEYAQMMLLGEEGLSRSEKAEQEQGQTAQQRKRDLLPLPWRPPEQHRFPKNDFHTQNCKSRVAARAGWLFLLVTVLNFHFLLGANPRRAVRTFGPTTVAQEAALVRLATAADVMCIMSPEAFGEHDWAKELPDARVGYDGAEVLRAEGLRLARVLPTLPPKGVTASLDLIPLVDGFTREALLDPSLVRLPDSEVDASWAEPTVRLEVPEELEPLVAELWDRGFFRVVDESEV